MNDILNEFYRRFYHSSPQPDLQRDIEDAPRQLIDRLEKPERKLVLRIIDIKDMIAGTGAQERFNCNKIGIMGGGTVVDGDGDINKMVGIMGE